jgi:hypothetical protein
LEDFFHLDIYEMEHQMEQIIKRLSFSSVSPASSVRSSNTNRSLVLNHGGGVMSNNNNNNNSMLFISNNNSLLSHGNGTTNQQLPLAKDMDAPPTTTTKVQVCLRIKPCDSKVETIKVLDDTKVRATPPPGALPTFKVTEYSFSKVFGPETLQKEVFENVAGTLVSGLLDHGKDGLIFAYGVTNSGKTFTVEGNKANPGLIPLTLERIFLEKSNSTVYISYLQM